MQIIWRIGGIEAMWRVLAAAWAPRLSPPLPLGGTEQAVQAYHRVERALAVKLWVLARSTDGQSVYGSGGSPSQTERWASAPCFISKGVS
jgi:hypothetical protein